MADAGRVIAGSARGMRLAAPPSDVTRPLSDRVKQSLFAALEAQGALQGAFLDLFAGTGGAGIEALSRGAPSATFVERDRRTCAAIAENLGRTGLRGGWIICVDVIDYLRAGLAPEGEAYRACLLDPPYGDPAMATALELLGDDRLCWLGEEATVVAKHFWRSAPAQQVGSLRIDRQRRFGETMLTFYTRDATDQSQEM